MKVSSSQVWWLVMGMLVVLIFLIYLLRPGNLTLVTNNRSFASSTFKTEKEWKEILTPEQYYVLREKGTEGPFSSPLNSEKRPGTYVSADCGEPLFRSEQKYDSGTGWPSFWAPINEDVLVLQEDHDPFIGTRVEVLSKCGGHLGHVFDDGPEPTGKRYCMNGDALIFIPDEASSTIKK